MSSLSTSLSPVHLLNVFLLPTIFFSRLVFLFFLLSSPAVRVLMVTVVRVEGGSGGGGEGGVTGAGVGYTVEGW